MIKVIRKAGEKVDQVESAIGHAISTRRISWLPLLASINQPRQEPPTPSEDDEDTVIGSDLPTPVTAVKRKITIKLDRDGNIISPRGKITLGSKFDRNVTILHFDLSDLLWHESSNKNYIFRLAFFDEEKYANPMNVEGIEVDDPDYQGDVYEFDGYDFWVPWELTKEPKTYKIALIIKEIEKTDDLEGNVNHSEAFVSAMFEGEVLDNYFIRGQINIDQVEPVVKTTSLTKSSIVVVLADDGTLAVNNRKLGNEKDSYIRRLSFAKTMTAHLADFNCYMLFKPHDSEDLSSIMAVKIDPLATSWVPDEVTKTSGIYDVMIIAYYGDYADPDYFYTSSVIQMIVCGNFLQENAFASSVGEGSGGDILVSN